jgi:replicative DNA helicase
MKTLPVSEESERGVLGSCLLDPTIIGSIQLHEHDFYDPRNQKLWVALNDQYTEGKAMDAITIGSWLQDNNQLELVGGYDRLVELQDAALVSAHSQFYAEGVLKASKLRQEIKALEEGLVVAYDGNSASEGVISSLIRVNVDTQKDLSIEEHGEKFIEDCVNARCGHFGWWCPEWTEKLGKQSSELVLLHAPRSTGKTALMLQWQIAAHMRGDRTPLASIEMLKGELLPRYLAHVGQMDTYRMKVRPIGATEDEAHRARKALKRVAELDLCVRDKGMTIEDIRGWAVAEWREGAQAIFVDNLLSISDGGKKYDSKTIMYDDFIRKFRDLRDDLQIPIIILAHPNANMEIAWSKDVENFADQIILLANVPQDGIEVNGQTVYHLPLNGTHVIAKFQKNRQGLSPVASLEFNGVTQTFKHIQWET